MLGKGIILFSLITTSLSEPTVVQTRSGLVRGAEIFNVRETNVTLFVGIPYAEPPIGTLRFRPPVPANPWTDVLNATTMPIPCIQNTVPGFADVISKRTASEDCLKLNVVVPSPAPTNAPVLVFVHGGAFALGSSSHILRSVYGLVSQENLIFVSMGYRLNVFGFLGLGTPEVPGNLGLMDQHLAFVWVKENIEAFGGDPNSITIVGMSAGSMSVGYHLLANKQAGLFHRAILMSGGPVGHGLLDPERIVSKSRSLAIAVGCTNYNTTLECLQETPAEELLKAESGNLLHSADFFKPTVDGVYVTEDPRAPLESGRFSPVPILIGVTSNEGGEFAYGPNRHLFNNHNAGLSPKNFEVLLGTLLGPDANRATVETAGLFYKNLASPTDELMLRDAAARAAGDHIFVCAVNTFCDNYFTAGADIYKYVYDQKLFSFTDMDWLGPQHSTDLAVVFGVGIGDEGLSEVEQNFRRMLLKYWINFIRTGNPNSAADEYPRWPRFNLVHRHYMRLTLHPQVESHHRIKECSFWNDLLPTLRNFGRCQNNETFV